MDKNEESLVKDPVCGMIVEPDHQVIYVDQGDNRVYFCCEECRKQFQANPEKFEKPKGRVRGFLDRLARAAEEEFGPEGPESHEKILGGQGGKHS